eukprot:g63768.t1
MAARVCSLRLLSLLALWLAAATGILLHVAFTFRPTPPAALRSSLLRASRFATMAEAFCVDTANNTADCTDLPRPALVALSVALLAGLLVCVFIGQDHGEAPKDRTCIQAFSMVAFPAITLCAISGIAGLIPCWWGAVALEVYMVVDGLYILCAGPGSVASHRQLILFHHLISFSLAAVGLSVPLVAELVCWGSLVEISTFFYVLTVTAHKGKWAKPTRVLLTGLFWATSIPTRCFLLPVVLHRSLYAQPHFHPWLRMAAVAGGDWLMMFGLWWITVPLESLPAHLFKSYNFHWQVTYCIVNIIIMAIQVIVKFEYCFTHSVLVFLYSKCSFSLVSFHSGSKKTIL